MASNTHPSDDKRKRFEAFKAETLNAIDILRGMVELADDFEGIKESVHFQTSNLKLWVNRKDV